MGGLQKSMAGLGMGATESHLCSQTCQHICLSQEYVYSSIRCWACRNSPVIAVALQIIIPIPWSKYTRAVVRGSVRSLSATIIFGDGTSCCGHKYAHCLHVTDQSAVCFSDRLCKILQGSQRMKLCVLHLALLLHSDMTPESPMFSSFTLCHRFPNFSRLLPLHLGVCCAHYMYY